MKKSEIFDLLLDKVSSLCEVNKDLIIQGCKLQSVVDARILAVQYLRRIGLSDDDIALIVLQKLNTDNSEITVKDVKKKAKTVNSLFGSYSQRCLDSYSFCLLSMDIKKACHEKYKELYSEGMKELPIA